MATATDQQAELQRLAEQHGWRRTERDRLDIYMRGSVHVHVFWQGTGAVSGGARYEDYVLVSYTRDLAQIQGWLTR